MVIGIDFDDTCVDTWRIIKEKYKTYYPGFEVDLPENSPWDKEKIIMKNHMEEMVWDVNIYEGLQEFLDYCQDHHIKTILLTARGGDLQEIIEPTKEFIKKHNLHFDEMVFDLDAKGEICQKYGVDLMIDDSKSVLDEVAKYGIKTLRFGIKDDKHDYALSWRDALLYIKKGDL